MGWGVEKVKERNCMPCNAYKKKKFLNFWKEEEEAFFYEKREISQIPPSPLLCMHLRTGKH